jgi:hypothetical protein
LSWTAGIYVKHLSLTSFVSSEIGLFCIPCCPLAPAACCSAALQQSYSAGFDGLGLSEPLRGKLEQILADTDILTEGWLTKAKQLLSNMSVITDVPVTHVLVSEGHLVTTLAKLMAFRLEGHFGVEEVWSAKRATKYSCFKQIRKKYGAKTR